QCGRGKVMNNGRSLMLAPMHLVRGCDGGEVIVVQKLRVGQSREQMQVEGGERRCLLHRLLRTRIVFERKLSPAQVEKGIRQMIVQSDRLREFFLCLF